ncbi:MAG: PKD domain-containing protein, partial [Bacteroidales bacterium]|nr:PKD domain-containing protein [Bacteroidales bacterium]
IASTDTIEVFYPYYKFNDATICFGDTITSTSLSTAPGGWLSVTEATLQNPSLYNFQWSTGSSEPQIPISMAGEYRVTITDNNNCNITDTFYIAVDSMAFHAKLPPDTLQLCAGNTLQLQSGQTYVNNYVWTPGGQTNPSIIIDTSGRYHVTLTSPNNCLKNDSIYVNVIGTAPVANFSITGFCTGDSIHFTDLSTGVDSINYWQWIIHNDTIEQKNTAMVFNQAGTRNIKLTVGSYTGCLTDTSTTFNIKQGVTAGFFNDPLCAFTPALFTDTTPIPLGENLNSRHWFTYSSQVGTDSLLYFSPVTTDSLLLTLKITLQNGCSDSLSKLSPVVQSYPSPMPFNLISPQHNDFSSPYIEFKWNNTPGAIKYKLIITSDSLLNDTIFQSNFIYPSPNLQFTIYNYQLTSNYPHVFWHVVAYNPCHATTSSPIHKFNVFSQQTIPGMKLWLAADMGVITDANNRVSQWSDISGNNFHAIQNSSANRPLRMNSILNNKPVLRFDGTNDNFNIPFGQTFNQPNTFLIVWNISGSNTDNTSQGLITGVSPNARQDFWWRTINSFRISAGTDFDSYTKTIPFNPIVTALFFNGSNTKVFENGVQKTTSDGGTQGIHTLTIGTLSWATNAALKGDIAEIIFYNANLDNSKRQLIESYLYNKYWQGLNLGPDIYVQYGFCDTNITAPPGFTNLQWSTGVSTPFISVNKPGKYWLTGTNSLGIASTDTIEVFYPYYKFNDATICFGDTITSTSLSTAPGGWLSVTEATLQNPSLYNFQWSTGSSETQIPISMAGEYRVTIIDNNNCNITDTFYIAVDSMAYFLSLGSDASLCIGNNIFVNQGQSYISSYLWQPTGDTVSETTINLPGQYILQATSPNHCIAFDSVYAPATDTVPQINYNITNFCVNDSIYFQDLSQGYINQWAWTMGSQFSSTTQNPVIKFDTAGIYPLSLTIANTNGCYNDTNAFFVIRPAPQAIIQHYPPCTGIETLLKDNSIIPVGHNLSYRNWAINGFPLGSQQAFNYTFNSAGTYSVSLELVIDNLCSDQTVIQTTVSDVYPMPQSPSLISPQDSIVLYTVPWVFQWNQAPDAVKYKITIASDSSFSNIEHQSDFIYPSFASTSALTYSLNPLNLSQSLYWKVTAYNPCNVAIESDVRRFIIFNPSSISRLKLWLAADSSVIDSAGYINQWSDISGNNFHAIQSISANKPTKIENVLSNKPSIQFNGNSTVLISLFNQSFPQPNTAFALWRINASTGFSQAAFDGNSSSQRHLLYNINNNITIGSDVTQTLGYSKPLPFNFLLSTVIYNSPQSKIYENGYLKMSGNTGNHSVNGLNIGGGNDQWGGGRLNGDIAEIIFYDTLLTQTECQMVERYLMDKYQPPVCLGPDIYMYNTVCDTALHAGNGYAQYLWSTGDTTPGITVFQPGTYWVHVTDIFGRESSDTVKVDKTSFTVIDTIICLGTSATINPGGNPTDFTYEWSNGSAMPTVSVINQGNYWVKISDHFGCEKTFPFTVSIDNYELTATLGPDITICNGAAIGLAVGAPQTVSYTWNTTESTPTIVPLNVGQYSVTATNTRGCIARDTININLNGYLPTPDFTFSSVCEGVPMQFFDASTDHPTDPLVYWFWKFDSLGTSTSYQPNPLHIFTEPGYHAVTLQVRTSQICNASITVNVLVYDKPNIAFTPINGCKGSEVPFYDHSTLNYGQMSQWAWDFGDGNVDSVQNPAHTYPDVGIYTVKLKGTSSNGCKDSLEKTMDIKLGPEVDFDYTNVCFGQEVQFTDKTIVYPWSQLIYRKWDFGDGTQSLLVNPQHTFIDSAGFYDVSLNIKSINGCNITKIKTVKVNEIPYADFIPGSACEGVPHQLLDLSFVDNDSIVGWQWTFDELGNSNSQDPWFTFPEAGTFDVELQATSSAGCSNSIEFPIDVYESPLAKFTLSPRYGVSPLLVQFSNYTTGATQFLWNFGDNSGSSTQVHPSYVYTQNGIYTVELTAVNNLGCPNIYTDIVHVIPTVVDIGVKEVSASVSENFVTVSTRLQNLGTRILEKLNLFAIGSNGVIFREFWEGQLSPGEYLDFTFAAQFLVGDEDIIYVCVKAETMELENDVDLGNNEKCKALAEEFMALTPFPNPAGTEVFFDIIIPYEDQVDIQLYNLLGQKVSTIYEGILPSGLTRFKIKLDGLRHGTYAFIVSYREEKAISKFVKN